VNILILAFGSRGDVQPFVALGRGLQKAGHTVTICTCSRFESFIRSYGLNYSYASDDLLRLMGSDVGRKMMKDAVGLFVTVKTAVKLVKTSKPILKRMLEDSWAAARVTEPDLVIFNPNASGSKHIAEKLGVPAIMATPVPTFVSTAEYPAVGTPALRLGGWYNKFTYTMVEWANKMFLGVANDFRQKKLGLNKFPKSSGVLRTADGRPIPVLHHYSSHVVPRPHDWPSNAYVTGYWFLDRLDEWQPSAELQTFLDAGEAPVFVGFGSMAGRNPQRTATIVIEAIKQAGVRGILAAGWGGLEISDVPDTILRIDEVPYDWLFPRVSAVMHHGGAGTTAAGLRAGRPTIVCPFGMDQPFWGNRVHALGAGPKPIPQKKLTVEKLANALRTVTSNVALRNKAKSLGDLIRHEDGISNAIATIETSRGDHEVGV